MDSEVIKMIVNEEAVKKVLEETKGVKLVAATKYVDAPELDNLEALGVKYFGENRVQAFLDKYEKYHGKAQWHFIGTLQCNKVKYIIDKVSLIHSVNTYKLIDEIEKQAKKHDLVMNVLLQVNIAHEESKHGFDANEMDDVLNYIKENHPHIHPRGLMMMAPNIEPEETRKYFKATKDLLTKLQKDFPDYQLTELSMGMTNDYPIAMEEGATIVRLGHALFKDE